MKEKEEKKRRHKWDNPKHPFSANCIKCGCFRLAQKFTTGMGWLYYKNEDSIGLTASPNCNPTPSPHSETPSRF